MVSRPDLAGPPTSSTWKVAEAALSEHLVDYLGVWPPVDGIEIIGSHRRLEPGWDGALVLAVVVVSPLGTVVSVPPAALGETRALSDIEAPGFPEQLAAAVGAPRRASPWLVFRWSSEPAPLADVGTWVEPTDPALPQWLRVFPDKVLAVFDGNGGFLAGLGIKPHTSTGQEMAVGTQERARGGGLARRLVAQAAREILAGGGVPLYVHHPLNLASARAAEGAGFPDLGWRMLVVAAAPQTAP